MYRSNLFLFLLLSILVFSCQDNKIGPLHKEIMSVHDEIMPKTSKISYLYLAFREKMENDSTISNKLRNELALQVVDLEKAEDEMMVWMNDYISPQKLAAIKSENEIITYLNEQKIVISNIKIHTETSLKMAEKLKKDFSIND